MLVRSRDPEIPGLNTSVYVIVNYQNIFGEKYDRPFFRFMVRLIDRDEVLSLSVLQMVGASSKDPLGSSSKREKAMIEFLVSY